MSRHTEASRRYSADLRRAPHYVELIVDASLSGRLTPPTTQSTTGKLERYALVRLTDDVPARAHSVAPSPRVAAHRPRGAARRTLSEGRLHVQAPAPPLRERDQRTGSKAQTQVNISQAKNTPGHRRQRFSVYTLVDISLDALASDALDDSWPSPPRYSPPPSPKLRPSPSFTRFRTRAPSDSSSEGAGACTGTPSLLDLSVLSSPSLTLAYTPQALSPAARVRSTDGSCTSTSTTRRTLVGLGISGLFKADGTPFDGLGILPRRSDTPFRASPLPSSSSSHSSGADADDEQWWAYDEDAHELDGLLSSGGPRFDFGVTSASTPAPLRSPARLLDEAPPAWTPSPPAPAPGLARKFGLPRAPSQDDVFLARPAARSTSAQAGERAAGGRAARQRASMCGLAGLRGTPERPAWKP